MSRFRAIEDKDHAEVVRIVREAFVEPAKRFGITTDNCPVHPSQYSLERLKRDISIGRRFYVLDDNGEIVGCVCVRTGDNGTMELSRLAVDPLRQRRGAGAELVEHAVALARVEGAHAVRLFLFARHQQLVGWYERRGFALTDTFDVNDVPTPVSSMVRTLAGDAPPCMRLLGHGDEPALEAFLLEHRDTSAMLLSNLRKGGIVDEGRSRQATYLAAFRGGGIVGVICLGWNGTILVQAPVMLDQLARSLVSICPREIEGVVGSAEQVARLVQVLSLPTGKHEAVMMDSYEYLYGVNIDEMKVPEELASGAFRCRRAEPRDVPILTDWMMEFNIESLNRRLPRSEVESNLLRMAEEHDNRWVLESEHELLSTTGFNAAAAEIVQVGGVYTPPARRSRRYARCAVAGSLLEARGQGVERCVLFTAHENEPAQRAYEAIGFVRIGDFRLLLFKRPVQPRLTVPAF